MSAPKTKIFVGHLPDGCRSEDLVTLFSKFGTVTECDVINKYGFVHMRKPEEAAAAIKGLNNYNLMGSAISVEPSKSRLHPEPGAPGRARGGGGASSNYGRGRGGGPPRNGYGPQVNRATADVFRTYEQPATDAYYTSDRSTFGQERVRPSYTHSTFEQPSTTTYAIPTADDFRQRTLVTPAVASRDPYTISSSAASRSDAYDRFMASSAATYLFPSRSPPRTVSYDAVTSQNRPYGYYETVANMNSASTSEMESLLYGSLVCLFEK